MQLPLDGLNLALKHVLRIVGDPEPYRKQCIASMCKDHDISFDGRYVCIQSQPRQSS